MYSKLLCLCLLYSHAFYAYAKPTTPTKTALSTGHSTLRFNDLPNDLKIGIFAKVIRKHRKSLPSLRQVHSQWPALVEASLKEVPYIAEVLTHKHDWTQLAATAALNSQEPEHLQHLIHFEASLFSTLLAHKEKALIHATDWKTHGLAAFFAMNALWYSALQASEDAGVDAARDATQGIEKYHAYRAARAVIIQSAWRAAQSAVNATDLIENYNASKHQAWLAAYDFNHPVASNQAYRIAHNMVKDHDSSDNIGKIAYRIAETNAWIVFLDPEKQVLNKAYETAYHHLTENQLPLDAHSWFDSPQDFENNVEKYFGKESSLGKQEEELVSAQEYQLRYQFVAPLLKHLRRIGTQIWQLESQEV
ncbi:MAG: hypothetical protein OXT67_09085 [Zetaproteobacteria bacterium]|nr:hypothetical protein [Zetaproteobacteria bacterium]